MDLAFLLEKEGIAPVDLYFAKAALQGKEEGPLFFLLSYLFCAARQGHLCIRIEGGKLIPSPFLLVEEAKVAAFLEETVLGAFPLLAEETGLPLCVEGSCVYLKRNWQVEQIFCNNLQRLLSSPLALTVSSFTLSERANIEQRQAIEKALRSPVSLISGGPGTGKTFTAVEIVRALLSQLSQEEKEKVVIKIGAPTGKAASLLEKNVSDRVEKIPHLAFGTLHSFLSVRGASLFADLFLVDEASMLDAELFARLLKALRPGGRLVLMGDKDQLPPVEAGGFFSDLCGLDWMPKTILQTSLRMESQELNSFARAILEGEFERVKESKDKVDLTFFSEEASMQTLIGRMCQANATLDDPFVALKNFQKECLLVSLRRGLWGVESLNNKILQTLLRKYPERTHFILPILLTKNDASRQFMNGDTGVIYVSRDSLEKGFYGSEDRAYFRSKEETEGVREESVLTLPHFEWAFCLSIHKSQGSEYDFVDVLLPPGSERFGREILYTAVTRAKKGVRLLSDERILRALLQKSTKKISGLSLRSLSC